MRWTLGRPPMQQWCIKWLGPWEKDVYTPLPSRPKTLPSDSSQALAPNSQSPIRGVIFIASQNIIPGTPTPP